MSIKTVVIFLIVLIFGIYLGFSLQKSAVTPPPTTTNPVIVTGEANPGRISVYTRNSNGDFVKQSIDTGFRYVWTVRIGDVRNEGRNRIYAGVSDSFYNGHLDCQVLEFDPQNNFKKVVIDRVNDLRCKDLAIGDLYNNGKKELVLGTHGLGIIKAYFYDAATDSWKSQLIDENYIATVDKQNNTDHKLPAAVAPFPMTDQTDVHIVRIGDALNNGKNQLVAAISDPIENPNSNHVLFLKIFQYKNGKWTSSIIDSLTNPVAYKAMIDVVDLYGNGHHEVIAAASPHDINLYTYKNGKWQKQVVDHEDQSMENVIKGVTVDSLSAGAKKSIIALTGMPQSAVYRYDFENGKFVKTQLANISSLLAKYHMFAGMGETGFDVKTIDYGNSSKKAIVFVGEQDTSFLGSKAGTTVFGFEASSIGYTGVLWPEQNGEYSPQFLDFHSAIALDVGTLKSL